jgi:hypothetical protein
MDNQEEIAHKHYVQVGIESVAVGNVDRFYGCLNEDENSKAKSLLGAHRTYLVHSEKFLGETWLTTQEIRAQVSKMEEELNGK